MGPLLKSFSRLERIQYWVSGLGSARIEACVRFFPQRFPKLPKRFQKIGNRKWNAVAKELFKSSKPFTDISQFVGGMLQGSDLHKDDREGLP
jgi:hypothetical protein